MRTVLKLAIAMPFLGIITPDHLAAQKRGLVDVSPTHFRRGFWIEAGGGWGEESYKFDGDPVGYAESLGKPTFVFRLGGTVNPHLRLGGEITGWWNSYQNNDEFGVYDVTETLASFMAIARVFPSKKLGLHFTGGAGVGVSSADVDYGNSTSEEGFAYRVGAGWEIRLGKQLFLTPAMDFYQHSYEKRDEPTLHERLVNYNLTLTWQPGR
jgi:hypothetical protein